MLTPTDRRVLCVHACADSNAVHVKLYRHLFGEVFKVQVQPCDHDRDLPQIDFSCMHYTLVPTHTRAAPVGACAGPVRFDRAFDVDAFRQYAELVVDVEIKSTALHRLRTLFRIIYGADSPVQHLEMQEQARDNCVLGFSVLEVEQPKFNNKIRELVKTGNIWHGLNGRRELKNPTWVVYELLRQIGVRPQKYCRGPKEHDPDPKDFMYATRYIFCRDTLLKNRHRLQVPCRAVLYASGGARARS